MNDTDQNPQTPFTPEEMLTLQALHTKYQRDHDRFSDPEQARLRFLRWLYETGRLDSQPECGTADARTGDCNGGSTDGKRHEAEDGRQPE